MKKRVPLLLATLTMLTFSCANSQTEKKQPITHSEKEIKETVKKMFGHAQGNKLELVDVEPTNKTVVLRAYKLKFKDKNGSRYIYGYVWMSDDGKMALKVYKLEGERNGMPLASVIEPEHREEMIKTDLSWFKNILSKLDKNNIPHIVGNGNKTVYIVWDVYCPFCYQNFNKVAKALKNGIKLVFVPLPVHGDQSIRGFVYYTYLARKEGAQKAMGHIFKRGKNFTEFRESYMKEVNENYKNIPEKERKELEKFYKDMRKELLKKGINATPTIIYIPKGEKDKGYIHRGFIPFEKLFKLK